MASLASGVLLLLALGGITREAVGQSKMYLIGGHRGRIMRQFVYTVIIFMQRTFAATFAALGIKLALTEQ